MKTITFELSSPVSYSSPSSGGEIEGRHVDLIEPTGRVSHFCCDIESMIQSGIMSMSSMLDDSTIAAAKEEASQAKQSEEKEQEAPTADSVLSLMSSGGVDMKRVVVTFRELFKEVATIGGEKKMTLPLMDRMSHKDFRNMMGEYAANFILN